MVLLTQFSTLQEAQIARGMLESNGVDAVVSEGALSSVFPSLDLTDSQVALFVPEDQAQKAIALLKDHGDLNE